MKADSQLEILKTWAWSNGIEIKFVSAFDFWVTLVHCILSFLDEVFETMGMHFLDKQEEEGIGTG